MRNGRRARAVGRAEREEGNRLAVLFERDRQRREACSRRLGGYRERARLADGPIGLVDAKRRRCFPARDDEDGAGEHEQQHDKADQPSHHAND